VGEVPSLEEIQPHERVTGLEKRVVDGQVGGRAGQGLHVGADALHRGVFVGEALGDSPGGQRFDDVHVIDALVESAVGIAAVTGALVFVIGEKVLCFAHGAGRGIAFGIDVVEDRSQGLADRFGGIAFRRNHYELARLALRFAFDQAGHIGVQRLDVAAKEEIGVL